MVGNESDKTLPFTGLVLVAPSGNAGLVLVQLVRSSRTCDLSSLVREHLDILTSPLLDHQVLGEITMGRAEQGVGRVV